MRFRSLAAAVLVALMVVVCVDQLSFAATGKSFILGKSNRAGSTTTLTKTRPGPVLQLKAKPGSPALAVSNGQRIAKLNADKLDGLNSSQLKSRVRSFEATPCPGVASLTGTAVKLADLGTFGKTFGLTKLRIDYSTSFYVVAGGSASGVVYELRIDDARTHLGTATRLVRETATHSPGAITGMWPTLGRGPHTLSLWAHAVNGTTNGVWADIGCFPGTNTVYVTEFP